MSTSASGPPSHWLGRRRPAREVDIAVVGGGIVGLSTAYWLAKSSLSGATKPSIALLEADHLAGRASGRNAGFLLTGSAEPFAELESSLGTDAALAFWRLSHENRELLRSELIDNGRVDCDFRGEGSWIGVSGDDDQMATLRKSAERLAGLGFDIDWREGDEVSAASGSPKVRGAIYQERDGGLDPLLLCRGIAEVGGFDVVTGTRVRALESEGDRVRLVTAGGDVVAERVVLALNAYAGQLVSELASTVRPVRAQMLAIEPAASITDRPTIRGVWYLNGGFEYVRQLANGKVLVGGCRWAAEAAERGYLEVPTGRVQSALEEFISTTYPWLAGGSVVRRWAGTMGFTADGLPQLGTLSDLPNVHYVVGFNGHGMSLGFATGRHLARQLLEGRQEPLLPPVVGG